MLSRDKHPFAVLPSVSVLSSDPVPLLIAQNQRGNDGLNRFTEHNARKGSIGYIMGYEVLNTAISMMNELMNDL